MSRPSITGILAIVLPQAVALKAAWDASSGGSDLRAFSEQYVNANVRHYTGFDPGTRSFDLGNLAVGWGPIVALKAVRAASRMSGFRGLPRSIPVTL